LTGWKTVSKIRPMEANLAGRTKKEETIRGGSLLLTRKIDLVGVALAVMRKRSEAPDLTAVSPVEMAVLTCFIMAQGQLEQMMEEQGRGEISEEAQKGIVGIMLKELLEEFLMMNLDEELD